MTTREKYPSYNPPSGTNQILCKHDSFELMADIQPHYNFVPNSPTNTCHLVLDILVVIFARDKYVVAQGCWRNETAPQQHSCAEATQLQLIFEFAFFPLVAIICRVQK